ncbi:MAG: TerB family tellurite resistance protein [Myxococcota bacterium]
MPVAIRGEIALPTNPNCILYATSANEALSAGWLTLQRAAWTGLEQFYSSCGIDTVAYVGRRAWLTRRNEPVDQLLLMFVMDGPATANDLRILELAVHTSPIHWSEGSMESMPPDAFPTLAVKSGKMYQLWSKFDEEPRFLYYDRVEGRVAVVGLRAHEADASEFLPYVRHVTVARRKVREADWRMERMRLAFAHHFSRQIVDADGVLHADEREFMQRVFPPDIMSSMGMDDHAAYQEALRDALQELPVLLGYHDKLAMIGLFFSVCHSDGKLDPREMRVLKEAATVLGLEGNEVVGYLTKLW